MLVYGDRTRTVDPRDVLGGLEAELAALDDLPAGLPRHARLAGALITAGELAQGLADAAFTQRGGLDAHSPATDLSQGVTNALAVGLAASWRVGFAVGAIPVQDLLARLRSVLPTDPIAVRTCEGYAYYAVYPELYAEAAAAMRPAPRVIGLRSIGTSLAAAAAAGCGADPPVTLRPCGDPFQRTVRLAPGLAAELTAPSPGGWAVVDEGPGLSGSSFGAVGNLLEGHGAPEAAVAYLPSHGGSPGREATPGRRARWDRARKPRIKFDDAIAPRLAAWADPLIGACLAPPVDISGGQWRSHGPAALHHAPAWPEQERRKVFLRTEAGDFLLKFAGLGAEGEAKFARARVLHRRGFAAEPIGLVHGFLLERWIDGDTLDASAARRSMVVEHLVRYCACRARHLDAPQPGATAERLRSMMVRNFGLAGLHREAEVAATITAPRQEPAVAIDGRLHAWEWRICRNGEMLKTDALDHTQAHDLIGAQGLAWDVAGATVEFGLSLSEGETLRAALEREVGRPIDPRRVAFDTLAYLSFQIGWWRLAANGCEGARAAEECARYEDAARRWMPLS